MNKLLKRSFFYHCCFLYYLQNSILCKTYEVTFNKLYGNYFRIRIIYFNPNSSLLSVFGRNLTLKCQKTEDDTPVFDNNI